MESTRSQDSSATRNAAALAQGLNTAATSTIADKIDKCAEAPKPLISACTAPAPNTSAGTYKGNTSNVSKTSPPLTPSVNAAPTAPIKDKTGVPSNRLKVKIQSALADKSNCRPRTGANRTKGKDSDSVGQAPAHSTASGRQATEWATQELATDS